MNALLRKLSLTAVAVAGLAGAMGAQAQMMNSTGTNYSLNTPGSRYFGFNAGQSDYSVGNGAGNFGSDRKDTAYNIYGGTYFNNNFGVELGYTDFGKINRGGGETEAEGINLSLVGRLPLSNSFNLLGKLGTTYGRTDVSSQGFGVASGKETGFGVSYGIGAEYSFNPQLSAVLQYDEHKLKFAGNGRDRVNATTVGLRYRF